MHEYEKDFHGRTMRALVGPADEHGGASVAERPLRQLHADREPSISPANIAFVTVSYGTRS